MSWSAVTAEHVRRAIAECDKLGHNDFRREYGFGEALVYDLVYEGHRYDSKAILGVAYIFANGERPRHYSGGAATVVPRLRELGFTVESRHVSEPSGWADAEIQPAVTAYFTMLRAELADQPYVKADFNREVQAATGRSHGAVEYKFQNISAVLRDLGLPYVVGYRPLPNLQNALRTEVERLCGGSRRAASWASECAVPTRARAALDPGFASVAAAGQVGAAGPVPACAEPVHPGAVQRWLVASRGGLALVSGRSIMTDAPRWYVQLRLLIDGRGEVSIGRYLFDAQHVEPRRARPADSRGIAPGGRT